MFTMSLDVDAAMAGLRKKEMELWIFGTSQIHARWSSLIAESSRHINMVDGDWRPRCFVSLLTQGKAIALVH